jgi:hypothetical protein
MSGIIYDRPEGGAMRYEYVAIPDAEVPPARDSLFQHLVTTYASETNKTACVWRAVPDDLLDYRPRDDEHDSGHPGASDPLRAPVLRPVRRHRRAARRRATAGG